MVKELIQRIRDARIKEPHNASDLAKQKCAKPATVTIWLEREPFKGEKEVAVDILEYQPADKNTGSDEIVTLGNATYIETGLSVDLLPDERQKAIDYFLNE